MSKAAEIHVSDTTAITNLAAIGILIEAKRRGLIQAVKPVLDELRAKAGFRLSQAIVERALREAGEP